MNPVLATTVVFRQVVALQRAAELNCVSQQGLNSRSLHFSSPVLTNIYGTPHHRSQEEKRTKEKRVVDAFAELLREKKAITGKSRWRTFPPPPQSRCTTRVSQPIGHSPLPQSSAFRQAALSAPSDNILGTSRSYSSWIASNSGSGNPREGKQRNT
jgi:hypothetical protein